MPHRFDPSRIERLTSPERADWLQPDRVLEALSLGPGMLVLDFGAGPGFFSVPIARRLGAQGGVICTDVEPAMLQALLQRAAAGDTRGIWPLLCDDRCLPLEDQSVDRVLVSLVLHELETRYALFSEIGRALRPGGLLIVVEWQPWQTEHGPSVGERLSAEQLMHELEAAGLRAGNCSALGKDCYVQTAKKA